MRRKRDGINKRELVMAVSEKTPATQKEVENIINCFIEEIKKQYRNDKNIEIRGFGTFYPQVNNARKFKIAKTGEIKEMPNRTTLKFKPSKKLRVFY